MALRENGRMHDIRPTDRGWALPGIANLHSHAFQRAMAGMAERQGDPNDSFWTWRETMYAMAERFKPELLRGTRPVTPVVRECFGDPLPFEEIDGFGERRWRSVGMLRLSVGGG